MNYSLRPYQELALERAMWARTLPGNELIVMPQGSGKSVVIAELARRLNEPLLILQPSKELLEQNMSKLLQYVDRSEIGVYSAAMNEKTINKYTFCTIGSIYKKSDYFKHFKTVLLDECDLLNQKNLNSMFTKFLKGINNPKVYGTTATPYRLSYISIPSGRFWKRVAAIKLINRTYPLFWSRVIFNITNPELIQQGFLCPLKYVDMSIIDHDDIPANKSLSDFNLEKYEEIISDKTQKIIEAISYGQSVSKYVLIFCSSVKQATKLQQLTKNSALVTGKTPKKEREEIVDNFRKGKLKTLFNVSVFSAGLDIPHLDCIILLRPTKSIRLYMQILGRGMRIAPGKEFCRVIDLTSTVKNLGRIETIKFTKASGKWELESETRASWHNHQLYNYKVPMKENFYKIWAQRPQLQERIAI